MDKAERKRLKKLYKEQELRKLIDSNDGGVIGEVMSDYAKNELGIKTEPLTQHLIAKTDESDLLELIYNKIISYSSWIYNKNPRHYKSSDNVIFSLSDDLIFIYTFQTFQNLHNLGGVENFVFNSTQREIDEFLNGLKNHGFKEFFKVFKSHDSDSIYDYFENNKQVINKRIIDYIRENSHKFEIE